MCKQIASVNSCVVETGYPPVQITRIFCILILIAKVAMGMITECPKKCRASILASNQKYVAANSILTE